jgi:hypothetical protein
MILIRLECMCILPGVLKRCTWILTCSVCPIPTPMQECSPALRWWCGKPATLYPDDVVSSPPQNLTQWSGPITCVASDLSQTCQKYNCTVWCIIGLQHLPPQIKNRHGLYEEKNFNKGKHDIRIELSDVTNVVSLDTTNLTVRVWTEWRKCQKKHFNSWLFIYYVNWLSGSILQTVWLSGYSSSLICFHIELWLFHL